MYVCTYLTESLCKIRSISYYKLATQMYLEINIIFHKLIDRIYCNMYMLYMRTYLTAFPCKILPNFHGKLVINP